MKKKNLLAAFGLLGLLLLSVLTFATALRFEALDLNIKQDSQQFEEANLVSVAEIKDCDDPQQTALNMCNKKYRVNVCKDWCETFGAEDACNWSPNQVNNCKSACSTTNGCRASLQ